MTEMAEKSGIGREALYKAMRKLGEMLAATPRNEGAKGIGESAVTKKIDTPLVVGR